MKITAKVLLDNEVLALSPDHSSAIIRQAIMKNISKEIEINGNSLLSQTMRDFPPSFQREYEVEVIVMHPNEYYLMRHRIDELEKQLYINKKENENEKTK